MHGYYIEVSFHEYALVAPGNGTLGLIETVQLEVFLVDYRLGRVYVLGQVLVGAHGASAEAYHAARYSVYGEEHAATEAVVEAALTVALAHACQAGVDKILVDVSGFVCRIYQRRRHVESVAELKALYHGIAESSVAEVLERDVAPVGGVVQIVAEVLQREIVHGKHGLAVVLGLPLLCRQLLLYNLYVVFAGKIAQGFLKAHLLVLHYEVDRRAALAAAETLADVACLVDRERRRALVVERAQALVVGARAAQLHKVAHHLHNVGGIYYAVYSILVYSTHCSELVSGFRC